jgi:uncharacterized protein YlaI
MTCCEHPNLILVTIKKLAGSWFYHYMCHRCENRVVREGSEPVQSEHSRWNDPFV